MANGKKKQMAPVRKACAFKHTMHTKTPYRWGLIFLTKLEFWWYASVQLLDNSLEHSGPFPFFRVLAFTFIKIIPCLQGGCSHTDLAFLFKLEKELRYQLYVKKQKTFQNPPQQIYLCFIVTWALPAGLGPRKARDRNITIGLDHGSASFSCNRPDSKYFKFGRPQSPVCVVITQFCHSGVTAAIFNI